VAIIPLQTRQAQVAARRHEDRFPRERGEPSRGQPVGVVALVVATAIVAGSMAGLLAYDAQRPLAMGAANAPARSLVISVEPSASGENP
jgi:hypothetical protein